MVHDIMENSSKFLLDSTTCWTRNEKKAKPVVVLKSHCGSSPQTSDCLGKWVEIYILAFKKFRQLKKKKNINWIIAIFLKT